MNKNIKSLIGIVFLEFLQLKIHVLEKDEG